MTKRLSAGLLMYRLRELELQVFLVHPGGPLYAKKNEGYWTLPKGEPPPEGESLLETAMREFTEETGMIPIAPFLDLGRITQKGGKVVQAWAFEGDCDDERSVRSNTFEMEWPPRSGRMQSFPEVDRGRFLSLTDAKACIRAEQWPLVERLVQLLHQRTTSA